MPPPPPANMTPPSKYLSPPAVVALPPADEMPPPASFRKTLYTAAAEEKHVDPDMKRTNQQNALRFFLGGRAAACKSSFPGSDEHEGPGACSPPASPLSKTPPTPPPTPAKSSYVESEANESRDVLRGRGLQQMRQLLRGRRPVLFLDYDGTLAPIVSDPEKAFMAPGMREVLQRASEGPARLTTAIISGRARHKVENFVGLGSHSIVYAGSHGFDISGPPRPRCHKAAGKACDMSGKLRDGCHAKGEGVGNSRGATTPSHGESSPCRASPGRLTEEGILGQGEEKEGGEEDEASEEGSEDDGSQQSAESDELMSYQVGERFRPVLESVRARLEAALSPVEGAAVEDNNFALSVHYRNVTGRIATSLGEGFSGDAGEEAAVAAAVRHVRTVVAEQMAEYAETLDVSFSFVNVCSVHSFQPTTTTNCWC